MNWTGLDKKTLRVVIPFAILLVLLWAHQIWDYYANIAGG